jgi:tetraacyldisaccharide 4'-kinase
MSRALLSPLVPLYAAAVGARKFAHDHGWLQPKRLRWPVVSVGNLSVGGSGKTPLVIRLAQLLTSQGRSVDVLSRGYGRKSSKEARVDPEGSAEQYGDEPILIARNARVPVYVGASRYTAGLRAESEASSAGVHLLDDGFQHRQLARDVDIAVLHRSDFDESLLPAGRLREPLAALERASVVVLRSEDKHLEDELRKRGIDALVWIQHRRLVVDPVTRAVAFCGIARPEEFFTSLRESGVEIAATSQYRDHHAYTDSDLEQLVQLRDKHHAERLVTTEKDWVRMTSKQSARLAPLNVARLEVVFENEAAVTAQLLSLLVRK